MKRGCDGRRISFLLRSTGIFILFSFSFHVPRVSDPFRPKVLPFSASNLPVARNKPPLPWLLPCRIFPWVSTVAFLSHCIAPYHRDDDVGHYHDDSQGPRGWRFVCLFSFPPPLRPTIFLEPVEGVRFIVTDYISAGFYVSGSCR